MLFVLKKIQRCGEALDSGHLMHPYPQVYKILLKSLGIYWPLLSTFLMGRLIEPHKSLRMWLIREVTYCRNQSLQRLRPSLSFHSDYVLVVYFPNIMLVWIWDHQSELYLGNFRYMCGLARTCHLFWLISCSWSSSPQLSYKNTGYGPEQKKKKKKKKKDTHTDKRKHRLCLSQEIGLNF